MVEGRRSLVFVGLVPGVMNSKKAEGRGGQARQRRTSPLMMVVRKTWPAREKKWRRGGAKREGGEERERDHARTV